MTFMLLDFLLVLLADEDCVTDLNTVVGIYHGSSHGKHALHTHMHRQKRGLVTQTQIYQEKGKDERKNQTVRNFRKCAFA